MLLFGELCYDYNSSMLMQNCIYVTRYHERIKPDDAGLLFVASWTGNRNRIGRSNNINVKSYPSTKAPATIISFIADFEAIVMHLSISHRTFSFRKQRKKLFFPLKHIFPKVNNPPTKIVSLYS